MKILSVILSLILLTAQEPQSQKSYWDAVIDSYEQLCKACADGKDSANILQLKQDFDNLLQDPVGKMNDSQKKRFEALRNRYSSISPVSVTQKTDTVIIVQQPIIEKIREIERITVIDTVKRTENVSVIKVENVYHKKDTTVVIHEYRAPKAQSKRDKSTASEAAGKQHQAPAVRPRKAARKPVSITLAATAAFVPDFSVGGMLGLGSENIGGYVKARSNFAETGYDYECSSESSGLWSNGNETVSRTLLTAGAYFKLAGNLRMYAGAGYGENGLYFQNVDGAWTRISDYSNRGVSFDLGGFYDFGRIRLLLGVSTTSFKYLDAEAGIGVRLF